MRLCITSIVGLAFSVPALGQWVTIQGQVVWPHGAAIPEMKPLNVTADKDHCLSKGPIHSEVWTINTKNRGVKGVWVWLRPDKNDRAAKLDPENEIAPHLRKPAPKTFDVDQPCCAFVPHIFAIREGDFVNFKNSSPISHNVRLEADPPSPSYNQTIAKGQNFQHSTPFTAQRSPIEFSCSMHPWMNGKFMVFDHPYFAVTDDDGKFTIKDCPAGKFRIVYRHETGFHKGKDGTLGWPIEIKAGADGAMALEPLAFEAIEKK